MENRLNMSLDDLIKINKSYAAPRTRGARPGPGPGPAPSRRFVNRFANRPAPYMPKAPDTFWKHDMFGNQGVLGIGGVGGSSIETGTKLYLSNLEYGVSNDDIKELFSEVGGLKRYGIHYDRSGRSKGTAEVVYERMVDAIAAVKRYNNVELDGKPMKIEIVSSPEILPPAVNTAPRRPIGIYRSLPGRGGPIGRARGGRGFGRGGRGRGRGGDEKVSVEDLDADLDKYHTAAMQTN